MYEQGVAPSFQDKGKIPELFKTISGKTKSQNTVITDITAKLIALQAHVKKVFAKKNVTASKGKK